ncbi:hypothetical protein [Novosphingobium sp. PhB165]|uniref:hypothetical protein n=1 Tax=Novosphingobium sp. PhB165 TaxID=2485105 RepID=UPI001405288A|nr:hypothetical protein [Novosphingobium sp. PhB165]
MNSTVHTTWTDATPASHWGITNERSTKEETPAISEANGYPCDMRDRGLNRG